MPDKISKAEAVQIVQAAQANLAQVANQPGAQTVLALLRSLGQQVGYTPAFRALVMNAEPDKAIRWKE